jgi:hypothetical protein
MDVRMVRANGDGVFATDSTDDTDGLAATAMTANVNGTVFVFLLSCFPKYLGTLPLTYLAKRPPLAAWQTDMRPLLRLHRSPLVIRSGV